MANCGILRWLFGAALIIAVSMATTSAKADKYAPYIFTGGAKGGAAKFGVSTFACVESQDAVSTLKTYRRWRLKLINQEDYAAHLHDQVAKSRCYRFRTDHVWLETIVYGAESELVKTSATEKNTLPSTPGCSLGYVSICHPRGARICRGHRLEAERDGFVDWRDLAGKADIRGSELAAELFQQLVAGGCGSGDGYDGQTGNDPAYKSSTHSGILAVEKGDHNSADPMGPKVRSCSVAASAVAPAWSAQPCPRHALMRPIASMMFSVELA